MIYVTRLNGQEYLINNRHIEFAEEKPDTTITLTSGKVLIIKESLEELQEKIIAFESQLSHRKIVNEMKESL